MSHDRLPDLSRDFPHSVPVVKINSDVDNRAHGPHYDIIQSIPGGIDKTRVDPTGNVIGGESQIGPYKHRW